MWVVRVVVLPPRLGDGLRCEDRTVPVCVHQLVPNSRVKRFDERVLGWLPRLDEDQLDVAFQGPLLQSACDELRTVIDSKCRGIAELARHILESANDRDARVRKCWVDGEAVAAALIEQRKSSKRSTIASGDRRQSPSSKSHSAALLGAGEFRAHTSLDCVAGDAISEGFQAGTTAENAYSSCTSPHRRPRARKQHTDACSRIAVGPERAW
jgi:hypothetical protein